MDNFEKTEYLNLNKLTNLNVYDVDPIMENFSLGEDKIKEVENSLDQLELKDTAIDVVSEEKKLNIVLSELRAEDIEQSTDILNLKNELNGYVARHALANDSIQKSIND